MSNDADFLRRWSRRKLAARSGVEAPAPVTPPIEPAPPAIPDSETAAQPLPPAESLNFESDFTQFMKPDVDPGARREALKVLLRDPRFDVMDGLDVYIDDYSKPDPLPAEWLGQLNQMKHLGHYIEEVVKAVEGKTPEAAVPLQNLIPERLPEQPVAITRETPPADTESDGKAPSQ